ncbi:MAG: nitrilase-related carbon-nitrogen hydrolase [Bacteroidota bacterium]
MKSYFRQHGISFLLILLAVILGNPQLNWPIATWVGTIASVFFFRRQHAWKALLILFPVYLPAFFFSNRGVIPFPDGTLLVLSCLICLLGLLPFALDGWLYRKLPRGLRLLFLPAAAIVFNLWLSQGPTGAMGFMANTQATIGPLMQWTAWIGIFGIGFLIYLTTSVVYAIWENYLQNLPYRKGLIALSVAWGLILGGGALRQYQGVQEISEVPSVRVASITAETTPFLETMYQAHTGEQKQFSRTLNQSDPDLQVLSVSMQSFKDQPDNPRFADVHAQTQRQFARLLTDAEKSVRQGAKIILTSEAEIATTKDREAYYIQRAQSFAQEHEVYFFLGMASLLPDLRFPEAPFVENKILVIDPKGKVYDTYFKNVPVEGADPSVPGDGQLKVLETEYGRLSYAICYDTDFPDLMRQAGQLEVDILLVPTGDWYAISPYHTLAANIRSIESGFSQVRAVSNGLSSVVDAFGHYHATEDFFADEEHVMIAEVPVLHKATFFASFGDLVSPLSLLLLLSCVMSLLWRGLRKLRVRQ